MRDIKRIDRICDKLKKLGKCYSDERFGQFIMNHLFDDGKDPFFKEDEREEGMNDECATLTGEAKIDKQIERYTLGRRVMDETNYRKDGHKYFEAETKGMKQNPMIWVKESGEAVLKKESKIKPPVEPKGENYIKDLK